MTSPSQQPLILASTSVFRKALLERLQVPFLQLAPTCDEEALKEEFFQKSKASLKKLPEFLARKKAESLVSNYEDHVLVGSDQIALFEDQVLSKPGNKDRAVEQLMKLQGNTHQIITSMAVYHKGQWTEHTDVSKLTMKPLTKKQVESYVRKDEPFHSAGSYKIEELGIALFEQVKTEDMTAITGLPLMALSDILLKNQVPVL